MSDMKQGIENIQEIEEAAPSPIKPGGNLLPRVERSSGF